ncbi:MAG TPA: winged helix-turn-helix domain-containing protein, partial [Burkholderiaceae bacterium]|nr:winged helix-turn-helix domain-containing protein [Burkholderiaceae bacterium]
MSGFHRFGRFEVRRAERQLLVDGQPAALGARAFDVLEALIERRDRVVAKIELLELVWPGLVVEENNLQVQVSSLRKLLGPQAIATVPGRGYRFVAPLRDGAADGPAGEARLRGAAPTPTVAASTPATNLPTTIAPLFGRADDLALLGSLVDSHRVVTVLGAGGIGKSRLAQAVAHARIGRWPDGVWMIELAGVTDPDLLPPVVARPLGL